ncbi:MAG: hypothetical protein KJ607_05970 [Bacteroidetes bacterium]|nr:hypothetical protein [Bacteroidota bacterium]
MKRTSLILLLSLSVGFCYGQGSKQRSKQNVIREICWIKDYETGDKEYKDSEEFFDENGKVIKEFVYDVSGNIKDHFTYEYNEDGKRIKKTEFDDKGKIKNYEVYEYDGKKLIKETFYNSNGNVKKTFTYTYDGKFLKEKKRLDAQDKIVWVKRYEYVKSENEGE